MCKGTGFCVVLCCVTTKCQDFKIRFLGPIVVFTGLLLFILLGGVFSVETWRIS